MTDEVPFCDLRAGRAHDAARVEAALLRVARSGQYVLGPEVEAFEAEFAAASRTSHAVGVGSGTDALALILRAAGIGPGDEVIVPGLTAAATWIGVALSGARPVGADVDPRSRLIDPDAVRAVIGPRTGAIVGVDLYGRLAPWAQLRRLAAEHDLLLIEDAAHAAGVDEGEGPAGSLADAAAFSFYPTKPLGGLGDGGAVTTSDPALAATVRRLRSYGWSHWQGQVSKSGVNSRLDELQAAVLRERLRDLPTVHARLRAMGRRYRSALRDMADFTLPEPPAAGEAPWHQFVLEAPDRPALRELLALRGVQTAVHYDPIPPALEAFADGRFPVAERLAASVLSLPFDHWNSDAQVEAVARALASSAASARSVT